MRMMGRIKVLRSLCKVLDSNFEDKLEELGQWEELEEGTAEWKTAENRLERTIQTLLETREERYNKLKECGTKVIQQWKSNDTPPSRIVDFSEALAFYDAASATESSAQLTGYKALNIDSIKKINNEILLQKSLELKKLKDKFVRRKSKLLSLIQKSHFPSSLVHFDFEMKVETNEDYFVACKELKEAISKAKAQVVKRKEIIMRTEMLELAVDQTMPLANIDGFIQVIETQVDVLVQEEGRPFIYDDGDIHLTLDRLQTIDSKKKAPQTSGSKLKIRELVLEKGMQEKASGTSGASFCLSAANAGEESLVVAPKKPTAVSRSSSRPKEKQTQPELRRITRLSAKVFTQEESSSSQIGEEEDYPGETSRTSSSLSAANGRKESRIVARKKPTARVRASSRLKEKETQPELRRMTRLSAKVLTQQQSLSSQTGEEEDYSGETSRASSSLSAANGRKESRIVARKKPAARVRASSRLKDKETQPELRRMTRLSAKVLTQQESPGSQTGEEDYSGETSRASSSLSAANGRKESRIVARKKPAAPLRASSRLKEKETQPELRRTTRVSVKVFSQQESPGSQSGEEYSGQSSLPVEPQLIASLPPHPRQPRTLRVEIRPGEAVKDDDNS
ncbi:hypothetical protein D1007_40765 [Hordeum vulgare]|nr:hypothetical protein D1007_40765 [Hordeum vulgare]